LDHSVWDSTSLWLGGDTTFDATTIEFRYNSNNSGEQYVTNFSFYANGNNITVEDDVNVTSYNYASGSPVAGTRYPNIFATTRNGLDAELEADPVITVKAGSWRYIVGAGHSVSTSKSASLIGNSTIVIDGANVEKIKATGVSPKANRQYSYVEGDVSITVKSGSVDEIIAITGAGYYDSIGNLAINLQGGTVGKITYKSTRNTSAEAPASKVIYYKDGTIDLAKIAAEFTANEIIETGVIYVSSTGTGDGSSAESPLGPGTVTDTVTNGSTTIRTTFENAAYADVIAWMKENVSVGKMVFANNALAKAHPLYRALEQLGAEGGKIVIVDELVIDAADAFERKYAGDFKLPETGAVKITGGTFVLDHSVWDSTSLWLGGDTTFDATTIEFRYNSNNSGEQYVTNFSFYANGNNITVEDDVNVTSYNYASGSPVAGTRYPNIFATTRNGLDAELEADPVITVKAGSWRYIVGAGHSVSTSKSASLIGNSTIVIDGANVEKIKATGVSPKANRQYSYVEGDVSITVKSGSVDEIIAITGAGYYDSIGNLAINLQGGTVGKITYKSTRNTSAEAPASKVVYYAYGTIDPAKIDAEFTANEVVEIFPYGEVDVVSGTLENNVILNIDYKVTDLTKSAIAAGKVKYVLTIGDETYETVVTAAMVDANNIVKISAELFATEMTTDVSVKLVVDGVETRTYTTTFEAYAEQMATENPEYADIAEAVLNYGELSQLHFGKIDSTTVVQAERKNELATYATGASVVPGASADYTYKYSTIVLFDKVAIRHYFTVADGADTTIFDGQNHLGYYVEEADILPQDFDKTIVTTVGDVTVNYSVFNYAYTVSQQTGYETAKNVVYALYDYFTAASAIA